jgi:sugar O-acyltransferase (sialic acid O-acetyltransferase NeuD family)
MEPIVVFGASGHAAVVIDILEKQGQYCVRGIIDTHKDQESKVLGHSVLGSEEILPRFSESEGIRAGIVAIGDNWIRARVVGRVRRILPGFRFVSAIHPSAQIGRDVAIGPGSAVMAGAVLNPRSRIGEHSIINTMASVDHDNTIGDFASLAPRAATGGNVRIGRFSAVCMGAIVAHGISIGEHTIIGAGATVLESVPDFVVAFGTPASVRRARQSGDKYL